MEFLTIKIKAIKVILLVATTRKSKALYAKKKKHIGNSEAISREIKSYHCV